MGIERNHKILLVDDDPADQKLIRTAMTRQELGDNLHSVSSAEEAISYLHYGENNGGTSFKPDLILLDINMPGMGGKGLLRRLKNDESLRQIPIIVLTSSTSERDVMDSYKLQAAGFVRKPSSLLELGQVIENIVKYWFDLCRLPLKE
ncbi:response regulator [Chloroflexota bacterium]